MSDKVTKNYKSLIQQKNVIEHDDFEKIVQEVYGLPYDVQRGELAQNSYIDFYEVIDGKGADQVGYWTGLSIGQYGVGIKYDNAKYVDFDFDDEKGILEYWANHSNTNASGYGDRPFDERYLDENGEYAFWQPPEYWVIDNLCARGIIEPGDYLITIDW